MEHTETDGEKKSSLRALFAVGVANAAPWSRRRKLSSLKICLKNNKISYRLWWNADSRTSWFFSALFPNLRFSTCVLSLGGGCWCSKVRHMPLPAATVNPSCKHVEEGGGEDRGWERRGLPTKWVCVCVCMLSQKLTGGLTGHFPCISRPKYQTGHIQIQHNHVYKWPIKSLYRRDRIMT